MKKQIKTLLLLALIASIASCVAHPLYNKFEKLQKQDKFMVSSNPLKRNGNQVEFTMSITLADNVLPFDTIPDTQYIFDIMYVTGDASKFIARGSTKNAVKVGEFNFRGKDYMDRKITPKQTKTLRFTYEEKYAQGYLVYYFFSHRAHFNKRFGPYLVTSKQKPVIGIVK